MVRAQGGTAEKMTGVSGEQGSDFFDAGGTAFVFAGDGGRAHGNFRAAEKHRAGQGNAAGEMDLGGAGGGDEGGGVFRGDAAAGEDLDPAGSLPDEPGQRGGSAWGIGLAATGEHAAETETDQGFEGLGEVAGDIEGPVENGRQRVAGGEQLAAGAFIDVSPGIKAAEDDGIGPAIAGGGDIVRHGAEFGGGVEEIAAAGADHHDDPAGEDPSCFAEGAGGGGEATFGEGGAEFDAVGSGAGGGLDGIERIEADFDNHDRAMAGLRLAVGGASVGA